MKTKEPKPYLTESSLGEALKVIFPDHEFIHNKTVPESGLKTRPDYRNDDLMLIVEFDGNRHFQQTQTQMRDNLKQSVYELMGYKVVKIPYFIQLSTNTIKYYFDVDVEWEQTYQHGFIDESCVLPSDFNTLGVRAFYAITRDMQDKGLIDEVVDIHISLGDKIVAEYKKGKGDFYNAILVTAPTSVGSMCADLVDMFSETDIFENEDVEEFLKVF